METKMYEHKRMTLEAALLMVAQDSSGLRMVEIEARLEGIIRAVKALEGIAPQQGAHKGMSVLIDRQCSLKTINRVATAIRSVLDSPRNGEMPFWLADTVRCYEDNARVAREEAERQASKAACERRSQAMRDEYIKTEAGWKPHTPAQKDSNINRAVRAYSAKAPFDPSTD